MIENKKKIESQLNKKRFNRGNSMIVPLGINHKQQTHQTGTNN